MYRWMLFIFWMVLCAAPANCWYYDAENNTPYFEFFESNDAKANSSDAVSSQASSDSESCHDDQSGSGGHDHESGQNSQFFDGNDSESACSSGSVLGNESRSDSGLGSGSSSGSSSGNGYSLGSGNYSSSCYESGLSLTEDSVREHAYDRALQDLSSQQEVKDDSYTHQTRSATLMNELCYQDFWQHKPRTVQRSCVYAWCKKKKEAVFGVSKKRVSTGQESGGNVVARDDVYRAYEQHVLGLEISKDKTFVDVMRKREPYFQKTMQNIEWRYEKNFKLKRPILLVF